MPYISQSERTRAKTEPTTPGELNYAITQLVLDYLGSHAPSYLTYNDVLGAMEGAKLEFYRRVVVPYEEQKRRENGDVYVG